jgi:hypothetical protein
MQTRKPNEKRGCSGVFTEGLLERERERERERDSGGKRREKKRREEEREGRKDTEDHPPVQNPAAQHMLPWYAFETRCPYGRPPGANSRCSRKYPAVASNLDTPLSIPTNL